MRAAVRGFCPADLTLPHPAARGSSAGGLCVASACQHFCLSLLAQEVHGMVEGCQEFMTSGGPALSLTAHIIGAPDVGTIVESVELSSGPDAPADLQECLTESMYALDLGPTAHDFEEDITVMLGGEMVELQALAGAQLDEQTAAAIAEALVDGGGNGSTVKVIHLGEAE